jgi:hypothetical protein
MCRPGNAPLPVPGLPPSVAVAPNLTGVATQLISFGPNRDENPLQMAAAFCSSCRFGQT